MEEVLHHLGYINLVNNGINYQPQLVSLPDFSHQQYQPFLLTDQFKGCARGCTSADIDEVPRVRTRYSNLTAPRGCAENPKKQRKGRDVLRLKGKFQAKIRAFAYEKEILDTPNTSNFSLPSTS